MATATVGALRVVLGLDSATFTEGLSKAQKHLRGVSQKMESVGQSMMLGGAGMTAAITAPFIAMGFAAAKSGGEARNAIGQVEAVLNSMGNASGKTIQSLKEQALALRSISTFDDDDILTKVSANMLSFGKVAGTAFDRAQLAALNLSARMGGDLQASAMMVGKALNSPVQGLAALRRVGIQFTAQQENQIKAMDKVGNVAGAQAIMLSELERQFGGAAQAARDADPWAKTRDSWRDMEGTLEDIALRVLPPLIAAFTSLIDVFNNMPTGMQQVAIGGVAVLAALGPVLVMFGTMTTVAGGFVGILAKMSPALLTATGSTTALGGAMVVLRGAMAFLLGPWGLLITGIAVALGFMVAKSLEATPAQKALKKATGDLAVATTAYEKAAYAAATASGEGKKAALAEANALKVIQVEARAAALEQVNLAKATLARARAQYAANRAAASNPENADSRTLSALNQVGGDLQARQRAALSLITDGAAAIASADEAINRIDQGLNRPAGGGGAVDPGDAPSARDAGRDRQEAEQRRRTIEDMKHALELEEAQGRGDEDRVRVLERERDVRERTRALIDAGIMKDAAAAAESERVQVRLDEAMVAGAEKEIKEGRRAFELDLWRLDGREDMVRQIERQIQLEERIAYYQKKGFDLVTATAAATSEMAEVDLARAEAAERTAKAAADQHEIELARLRGDERDVRRLSRSADIDARTLEYQSRDGLTPDAARAKAEVDVGELDSAELQGKFRDFVKDGWKAAMDGDLKSFAKSWVEDWASRGLEDALNGLGDLLKSLFSGMDWGGTKGPSGGGINWGDIASSIGSYFNKSPGFATGGSGVVGGSGGIDSKLITLRATPGELINIRRPGEDAGAGGGTTHVTVGVNDDRFNAYVDGRAAPAAAQAGAAAFTGARQTVPSDMAKTNRYTRRR